MQNFSPFPLRARGLLEIFDAAIKLYKQYFWVLLGWSAIVSGASLLGAFLPLGGLAALFLTPMTVGSIVCCLAAAVRGNNVEFGQCWRFTQPRYWIMLGMHLIAWIASFIGLGILTAIFAIVIVAAAYGLQSSGLAIQVTMGVLAFVVFGGIFTVVSTVLFTWIGLVPIVICMEEDKRGTNALSRAYDLLKGHWLRITVLMAIVGLGILALFAILGGLSVLIVGVGNLRDLMMGSGESTATLWLGLIAMGLTYSGLAILFTPLYYLILAVFYLDVRVRQEALDLEWTAHLSAPVAPAETAMPGFIPTPAAPQPEYSAAAFSPSQLSPPSPLNPPQQNPFGTRLLSDEPSTPAPLSTQVVLEKLDSMPPENSQQTPEQSPVQSPIQPPQQSPQQW